MTIVSKRVTLNCPPWCESDHRYGTDIDQYGRDLLTHTTEVGRLPEADALVAIAATDEYRPVAGRMVLHRRSAPTVTVWGGEDLTPDAARALATLLVEAAATVQQIASAQ